MFPNILFELGHQLLETPLQIWQIRCNSHWQYLTISNGRIVLSRVPSVDGMRQYHIQYRRTHDRMCRDDVSFTEETLMLVY